MTGHFVQNGMSPPVTLYGVNVSFGLARVICFTEMMISENNEMFLFIYLIKHKIYFYDKETNII